jgi:N-acetylmuramoyl-L-alanine amidase
MNPATFPIRHLAVAAIALAGLTAMLSLGAGCQVDAQASALEARAMWEQVRPTLVSETRSAGGAMVAAPRGAISVYKLASRLGLPTVQIHRDLTTLSGPGNIVTLFAGPRPQVFVNGRRVSNPGQIVAVGGVIFVPGPLPARLSPMLVRRPAPVEPAPFPQGVGGVVMIDPGHGGKDPGAKSVLGRWEKEVVLPVSLRLAEHLRRRGVEAILSRTKDRFIGLDERADLANRVNPDLFISIHADWARSRQANGHTLYLAEGASPQSRRAADVITEHLSRLQPAHSKPKTANFRVLVKTRCPAVLVELGYLSNARQARRLFDRDHQDNLARAIADGVAEVLTASASRR